VCRRGLLERLRDQLIEYALLLDSRRRSAPSSVCPLLAFVALCRDSSLRQLARKEG